MLPPLQLGGNGGKAFLNPGIDANAPNPDLNPKPTALAPTKGPLKEPSKESSPYRSPSERSLKAKGTQPLEGSASPDLRWFRVWGLGSSFRA